MVAWLGYFNYVSIRKNIDLGIVDECKYLSEFFRMN